VRVANSLTDDMFPDEVADLVVSQPPFGLDWRRDEQTVEQRRASGWFRFGLPPRSDSTWLFASRSVEKLRPADAGGGRAIVFAAPGALRDRGDPTLRSVLHADLLEAVIALPAGLSPNTEIPLYALVFANRKSANRTGKVQVVDLRPYFETSSDRRSTQRALRDEGLEVLRRSLASTRDDVAARTLPFDYFLRRRVRVTAGASAPETTAAV
jgi:type I restriction-modification system DNA methylase subunit